MMTLVEKIAMVKHLSDEGSDETISAFLSLAGEEICATCGVFDEAEKESFLNRYSSAHIHAAAYYLNKRGWDYEDSHNENGIVRHYESGALPDSILRMLPNKAVLVS